MSAREMNLILDEGRYIAYVAKKEITSELYNSAKAKISEEQDEMLTNRIKSEFLFSSVLRSQITQKKLNHLVLELGSDSFHLTVKCNGQEENGVLPEIKHFTYDEYPFLNYIDNAQLMPFLLSIFPHSLFCVGGVLLEIKDRRLSNNCEPRHVILKLTNSAILQYTKLFTNKHGIFRGKQSNDLEAQLLLRVSGNLCLKNNPAVAVVSNWLQHNSNILCKPALRRMAKRYREQRHNERNRSVFLDERDDAGKLLGFLSRKRSSADTSVIVPQKSAKIDNDKVPYALMKHQGLTHFSLDELFQFIMNAIPLPVLSPDEIEKITDDPNTFWKLYMEKEEQEEYLTEMVSEDLTKVRIIQSTRININKSLSEEQYYGELTSCSEYFGQNSVCTSFPLGSVVDVGKFMDKFMSVFTNDNTRYVRTIHRVHDIEEVTYTEKLERAIASERILLDHLGRTSNSMLSCYKSSVDKNDNSRDMWNISLKSILLDEPCGLQEPQGSFKQTYSFLPYAY